MADMTSEARVVALDRLWPGDIASRSGDLLDVVFGWADFTRLRRLVAGQCAAADLSGSRLDDFVLAVHEISANAIVHAGTGGRDPAASGQRPALPCCRPRTLRRGGPGAPGRRIPRARDGSDPLSSRERRRDGADDPAALLATRLPHAPNTRAGSRAHLDPGTAERPHPHLLSFRFALASLSRHPTSGRVAVAFEPPYWLDAAVDRPGRRREGAALPSLLKAGISLT